MKQKADRLFIMAFAGTLLLFSLLFFILPHQRFSHLENRYLQAVPVLTWDTLLSGKFAEEAEKFTTDHFPFRNKWLWLKSASEQLRLQQENNGVYKGKEGYLFEKCTEPDYRKIHQYTERVNEFANSRPDADMIYMLAPASVGLYPERLPWLAPSCPQKKVNEYVGKHLDSHITFLNGFDFLEPHADEPIYYRTDHHWTTYGAYLAYAAYAEQKGWQPLAESDFSIQTVSSSFLGSYHTKGQFAGLSPDTIQAYTPHRAVPAEVYIADSNETWTSLYDPGSLKKKDQYSYFLGGVHALMTITAKLGPEQIEQDKLLVIKDSYAHSVIPFLTNHVPEIHVVDIRYYNGSIADYMSRNRIRDVLFLFHTSSLEDGSFLLKLRN